MSVFRKVTNGDLMTKLSVVDNKLDILLGQITNGTIELRGCCDCQTREQKIYNELKVYLEEKMSEFEKTILNTIEKNQSPTEGLHDIFNSYRLDFLTSLEHIIELIKEHRTNEIIEQLKEQAEMIRLTQEQKLDLLIHDNQIIKHQFMLEESIRQYESDIVATKHQIALLIKRIDEQIN